MSPFLRGKNTAKTNVDFILLPWALPKATKISPFQLRAMPQAVMLPPFQGFDSIESVVFNKEKIVVNLIMSGGVKVEAVEVLNFMSLQ